MDMLVIKLMAPPFLHSHSGRLQSGWLNFPRSPLLGPILFLICINDLEEGVTGNILKFADDTKLFRKTKEIGGKKKLQDDIDKLVRWSEKWQMLFNFGNTQGLETLA